MERANLFIADELYVAFVYGEWFVGDSVDAVHNSIEEFEARYRVSPGFYRVEPISAFEEPREIQIGVE